MSGCIKLNEPFSLHKQQCVKDLCFPWQKHVFGSLQHYQLYSLRMMVYNYLEVIIIFMLYKNNSIS